MVMSKVGNLIRSFVPEKVKTYVRRNRGIKSTSSTRKHTEEFAFWEGWIQEHGLAPETEYYRKFMMDMGNIEDQSFFDNLICLDIGCGPKGSLTWLKNARAAIGLDPLAELYTRFAIDRHEMIYLSNPAESIPLPSRYVDVVFSMNSLDHVDDPVAASREVRRVLKRGGYFIGSLNLDEVPTETEPWTLTEEFLEEHLFAGWEKQFYKIRPRLNDPSHFGPYKYFYEHCPKDIMGVPGPRALWCRFRAT